MTNSTTILPEDTMLENRFRIDSLLAQGPTGATYRGYDTQLSIPVVIKEKYVQTPQEANQFRQEALILTGLRHPALPWVIHHFSQKERQYLVMDFTPGESVWELITKSAKPLPEQYALQSVLQVCRAVAYLHQQKPPIVHRDIKPHNLKFTPQGKAMLLDFGIVKEGPQLQAGGSELTRPYLSPEQRRGEALTPAADIYALGATLFTLLTAKVPPPEPAAIDLTLLTVTNPVSRSLAEAIIKAMQADPAGRPASIGAWQQMLEVALSNFAALGPSVTSSLLIAKPTPKEPAVSALPPANTGPNFWLIDPRGTGYPLETEQRTIGSDPAANIRLDQPNVAPFHALARIDKQRCLIMDNGSESGTLLNNHRLGSGWYPMDLGDILIIGPTRFHLTTTKPAKIASTPTPAAPLAAQAGPRSEMQSPVGPAQRKKRSWLPYLVVGLVLVGLLLAVGFIYWNQAAPPAPAPATPAGSETPTESAGLQPATAAASPTPTAPASETAVIKPITDNVVTPQETPTATTVAATATPVRPAPTVTSHLPTTTSTASPGQATIIFTPTATAMVTPTPTLSRPSPTPSGPTPLPVNAAESIEQIGRREVIDVDLNPKNPQEVYALVKRDGIYKSTSGGSGPWLKLPLRAIDLVALVIDPSNVARLYGPTWNAVLKSSDGGNSWETYTNGLQANKTVDLVTIDPVNPDTLYAGIGETLVVSIDGGQSWQSADYGRGLGVARLFSVVIDPFDHNTLYIGGLAGSIYKSSDGGLNFSQLPDNIGQGAYSIAAHPSQKNVYLIGINAASAAIMRSENGFNFSPASSGLVYGGADSAYSVIIYAPSEPNIVYAGTGYEDNRLAKGIFKSSNGGQSWGPINTGLAINPDTRQPYYVKAMAVDPTNPDIVFAATGNGLYHSTDGGATWSLR